MPSEPSREAREAAEAFAVEFVTSKPHGSAGDEIVWLGDRLTLPIVDSPGQTAVSVAMMRVTIKRTVARALDEFARKWRESWKQEHDSALEALAERDALRRRVAELEAEVERLRGVAGDALHDAAHHGLYRKIANDAATHWKARAEAAERALDEIAELDPEELGENDDEWGGAAVGARAQEIAEEARRGRGDG